MLLRDKLTTIGATITLAVAGSFVAGWEGKRNHAYRDIVGVWTICYGQTNNVHAGQYKNDEACIKDLAVDLADYNKQMRSYVKVPLKPYEEVAYTSFVWNLGITNFKNSTLLKKLNQGYNTQACAELLKWNRAGGKVVKGLVNRRQAEYETCIGKNEEINKLLEEK